MKRAALLAALMLLACSGSTEVPTEQITDDYTASMMGLKPGTKMTSEQKQVASKQMRSPLTIKVLERETETNGEAQRVRVEFSYDGEVGTYTGDYKKFREGWKLQDAFSPDAATQRRIKLVAAIENGLLGVSAARTSLVEYVSMNHKVPRSGADLGLPGQMMRGVGAIDSVEIIGDGGILLKYRSTVDAPMLEGRFVTLMPEISNGVIDRFTCKTNLTEYVPRVCRPKT